MTHLFEKLFVAGTTSVVCAETISVEPLISALITLGVSIVSVLMVEGVQWLKKFFETHTPKDKENKDKEEK